jgi:hypothetical protein
MARISELVTVKYGLMFGEVDVVKQHEYLYERVFPLLGIRGRGGLSITEVLQVRDYLINISPDCRVIAIEESGNWDGSVVEVWESYAEDYRSDWVDKAAVKLSPDITYTVYVKLPESVWNY